MTTADDIYRLAGTGTETDASTTDATWSNLVRVVPDDWYTVPAPPRRWLLRDARSQEGVLPLGKVGLLAAEGGAGKTMAAVQLALSVATGTTWLDTFEIPSSGKVLLVLGEEDAEEVHRRIYRAMQCLESPPEEGTISVLPLAGVPCSMIEAGEDSQFLRWLREHLERTGPYSLIILDPISRFCGADAERDNAAGTRFCQALESLVVASGGATVLGSHHVNKQSRGSGASVGASSARGSSALVDGVRWVATIGVEFTSDPTVNTVLTVSVAKSNYAKKPPPVSLRYNDEGVLVPMAANDQEAVEKARDAADPRTQRRAKEDVAKAKEKADHEAAVISVLEASPGLGASELRIRVKATAGCGADAADVAIARLIQTGRVLRRPEGRTKQHFLQTPVSNDSSDRARIAAQFADSFGHIDGFA